MEQSCRSHNEPRSNLATSTEVRGWTNSHLEEPSLDPVITVAMLCWAAMNRLQPKLPEDQSKDSSCHDIATQIYTLTNNRNNFPNGPEVYFSENDIIGLLPADVTCRPARKDDLCMPQEIIDVIFKDNFDPTALNISFSETHEGTTIDQSNQRILGDAKIRLQAILNRQDPNKYPEPKEAYFGPSAEKVGGLGSHSIMNAFLINRMLSNIKGGEERGLLVTNPYIDLELHQKGFYDVSESDITADTVGALLHDMGKASIYCWMLNRPLLPAEYELIKHHPDNGVIIWDQLVKMRCLDIPTLVDKKVRDTILYHHSLNPHSNFKRAYPVNNESDPNWEFRANASLPLFLDNFIDQCTAAMANTLERELQSETTRTREHTRINTMESIYREWLEEIPGKTEIDAMPGNEQLYWKKYQAALNVFIYNFKLIANEGFFDSGINGLNGFQQDLLDFLTSFDDPRVERWDIQDKTHLHIAEGGMIHRLLCDYDARSLYPYLHIESPIREYHNTQPDVIEL